MVENKIATETSDRELLGRPVARYSASFVFQWKSNFDTETSDGELLGYPVVRSPSFLFLLLLLLLLVSLLLLMMVMLMIIIIIILGVSGNFTLVDPHSVFRICYYSRVWCVAIDRYTMACSNKFILFFSGCCSVMPLSELLLIDPTS